MVVLVHLLPMRRMVVVVCPVLARMGMGVCLSASVVFVRMFMLVDVLVFMGMFVFMGVDRFSMLVRVRVGMLVFMGVNMRMLMFSFHGLPPSTHSR